MIGPQEAGFVVLVIIILIVGSRLMDAGKGYVKRQVDEADDEIKRKKSG